MKGVPLLLTWFHLGRDLQQKKNAPTKSIAVLKNTMQNEAYMTPIQ
jgi:hypothetical protein